MRTILRLLTLSLTVLVISGCGGKRPKNVGLGTAPIGGTFYTVGGDLAEVLNNNPPEGVKWKVEPRETKGSQANIRDLVNGKLQIAISNAAISYFAAEGGGGWDKKYDIRTVMTLAPNVAMFVTTKQSPIKTMADLKGKTVVVGPAGAGFQMFVEPILEAHGVKWDDLGKVLHEKPGAAVELIGDGNADAAFLGGGIPFPALKSACETYDIHFIPYEESAREKLLKEYAFFTKLPRAITPKDYKDLEGDYIGINTGSMHIITSANVDEETIYQLTKQLWSHKDKFSHPALTNSVKKGNVARFTGVKFHPGAEKFYREIGEWPEDAKSSGTSSASDKKEEPKKDATKKDATKKDDASKGDNKETPKKADAKKDDTKKAEAEKSDAKKDSKKDAKK